MFLLPTWMPNLKPPTEMTSAPSSEAVTMTTSTSSSASSPPLSHHESAFAAYKTMNDTSAAATTSFLSLHPPPTLSTSILEHTASMQRSLWQKLLPTDAISTAAAAVAAAMGTHSGPSHTTWNQELLGSHHYANSDGTFGDLLMDGGGFPRSKNGARESTGTLKAWLCRNLKNPYPSKGEKIMLAIITRMTLTQVSTWFANARRRLKKERTFRWRVDDDDDYSDEYNNDDDKDEDDGRDEKELSLLDEDDDDNESTVMNRTRGLKRRERDSPDFCCASKRRRCEDRSTPKRKRSGQTEEAKAGDVGTSRSLTLTWTESLGEGDGNKPLSSPLGSLTCSSSSNSNSIASSPPSSLPLSTSTCCSNDSIIDQQVALEETKRSDASPFGSTCIVRDQASVDAAAVTAVDLSISSKTNTTPGSSSSSSSSPTSSAASTLTVKPRIWSIVEIATT